jgi:hypothetical protein
VPSGRGVATRFECLDALQARIYVSSDCYICVLRLLYICVLLRVYMCVLILLYIIYVSSYGVATRFECLDALSSYYCIYVSSYCYICVLILLCICVLILLYMCPHTASCVLILLHMCPHTAIYVSSYCYIPGNDKGGRLKQPPYIYYTIYTTKALLRLY